MEKRRESFRFLLVMVVAVALSLGMSGYQRAFAENEEHENSGALLNVLQQSKVSLADGIRQATKGTEVPISAKFELDDEGKLSLSVYTAGKGLSVDVKDNVLKELSGSPESATWNPKEEVFTDQEHLERAGKHLQLVAKSKLSVLDIVEKASKKYPGTVFAVTPEVKDEKSVYEVKISKDGQVTEYHYDLITGDEVKMDKDADDKY